MDESGNLVFYERWETREHYQKYLAWRTETGTLAALASKLTGPRKSAITTELMYKHCQ